MSIEIEHTLQTVAELVKNADAVAIFAGAGMGVDSGLEQYRGSDGLWTKSIKINNSDIMYYDLMNHNAFEEMPEKAWGFIGSLIERYDSIKPHEGFTKLLELLSGKEYFVVTSNCDEHFQKAGYNENNILECHGSIYYMQCMDIKEKEIWLTPQIKVNKESVTAEDPLPLCPNCNSNCRPNLFLFGDWFWVSTRSVHQQLRFNSWCKEIKLKYKNILAIEIGAGKAIPTIRNAAERFSENKYPLVRINPNDFEIRSNSHISIPKGAKESILKIAETIKLINKDS